MTEIGLSLIAIAWLLQFLSMAEKNSFRVYVWFVALYMTGTAVLTLEAFLHQTGTPMMLNLITFLTSMIVLLRLLKKN